MSELGRVDGRLLGMLRFCGIRQFPWKEPLYSKWNVRFRKQEKKSLPIVLGTDTRDIKGDVLFQSTGFDVERVSIAIGVTNLILDCLIKVPNIQIYTKFLSFWISPKPDNWKGRLFGKFFLSENITRISKVKSPLVFHPDI